MKSNHRFTNVGLLVWELQTRNSDSKYRPVNKTQRYNGNGVRSQSAVKIVTQERRLREVSSTNSATTKVPSIQLANGLPSTHRPCKENKDAHGVVRIRGRRLQRVHNDAFHGPIL